MGYNEFISDKFASLHLKHEFKSLSYNFKISSLVSRVTIGSMANHKYHLGLNFKSLEKGYLESGLEFNTPFKGFIISAFYRNGFYKNPNFRDNFTVKTYL